MLRHLASALVLAIFAQAGLGQDVTVKQTEDHVDFLVGDELATRYHTAGFAKPIFWPINAPGQVPLTRAWPMDTSNPKESADHPHQKSAWFCHGDVIPEGHELKNKIKGVDGVDFWSEAAGAGKIICVKVEEPKTGKDMARVVTQNEWRTADGVKILDETRIISFHQLTGEGKKARLIVLDIDLLAGTYPITFGDTKEGSMGIRINDQLATGKNLPNKGKLENAEGKVSEKEVWGKISAWCDYSGPIDGKLVGLTIFSDPKNNPPACWHSRGYGLMAANPFGRIKAAFPDMKGKTELFRLAKGEHLRLRYGILAHEGDVASGRVAEMYQRFVQLRGEK
jgi:hypothetical protein